MKIALVLFCLVGLTGCFGGGMNYYSKSPDGRVIAFSHSGNLGMITQETVTNSGSLIPGINLGANAGGSRVITNTESVGQVSIHLADGTVIRGPIDNTAGQRETGNALKNWGILDRVIRPVWLTLLREVGDTARR